MKFIMMFIQFVLIPHFINAQALSNSSFIESNCNKRGDELLRRSMKNRYVDDIQNVLKLWDLISDLEKVDVIRTPTQLSIEGLRHFSYKNIFQIRQYESNHPIIDIQAIALYDYLKEMFENLSHLLTISSQSKEFFENIEGSLNNLIDITNKIQQSLKEIKDYLNSGDLQQDKDEMKRFSNSRNQNLIHHQHSSQSNLVQLNSSGMWEYQETSHISANCSNVQYRKLYNEYIFFLKVQETLLFIQQQQELDPIQAILIPFQDKFYLNAKIVIDFVKSLNLKKVDLRTQRFIQTLKFTHRKDDRDLKLIEEFHQQTIKTLKLIRTAQPLFDFEEQIIKKILNLYDKINVILENYDYQPDQVYKQLLQLDRDYKICKGSEDYEIIKDIKIPKINNVKQISDQNYIIPPINSDQCQRKVHDIEENLLQFIKQKILSLYDKFLDNSLLISYQLNGRPRIRQDRIRGFQVEYLYYFDEKFQRKLVKLAEYYSNYKPDDPQSVAAYESLQILNKKIWQISNFFDQAKLFIGFAQKGIYLIEKFSPLREDIQKIQAQKTTISASVQKQEVIEEYRDFKICTGQDFYEFHNMIHIYQRFINEQNDYLNLIIIEESEQKKVQVLKKKRKSIKKSQKPIKILHRKKSEPVSYIQVQEDWKYYDYSPILKNECKDELNIIKEDVLQFKKIQVLLQYQKSHQKNYNKIIDDFLYYEDPFIENMRLIKLKMEWFDLETNIIRLENIPKGASQNSRTELAFDKLEQFNKYLLDLNDSYNMAKSLLNLNKDDFSLIRFNQYVINEYLDKQFKYQSEDVEKELEQLYRDYQICTGRQYETEKADALKVIHQSFDTREKQSKIKMNKMNKKYQK